MCGLLNHKNRTILLLFYSCDDSSKCDLNLGRHTLVDERVFWVCCICAVHKNDHFFGNIQCLLSLECHTSVSGTEEFLSVWIYKNLNLGNTEILFEKSYADGRQVCHILKQLDGDLKKNLLKFEQGDNLSSKQRGGGGLGYIIKLNTKKYFAKIPKNKNSKNTKNYFYLLFCLKGKRNETIFTKPP